MCVYVYLSVCPSISIYLCFIVCKKNPTEVFMSTQNITI